MSDLKSPWLSDPKSSPGMAPMTDFSGDVVDARGGDPNITDGQKETENSVSGLPTLPSRFQPADTPSSEMPNLEDRRPGTIDEK